LIAFNLGIPQNRNTAAIAQQALNVNVPEFKPKIVKVELPGEENKNQNEAPQQEAAPEDE
jgi:hypothetical protein